MWTDTEFVKRLGIAYPIIQGPLGGGLSPVPLVVTVSQAGGLGSYGASGLSPPQIKEISAEIRTQTDRPFALNLWVTPDREPMLSGEAFEHMLTLLAPYYRELGLDTPAAPSKFGQDFDAQVEAVLAVKPHVCSFVFGIPSKEVLRDCRQRGIFTIGTATTVDEAHALEEAGVSAIAATGSEAGGMRASFLRFDDDPLTGTFALVPQVADAVRIPVVAAGGIVDSRGIVAALALGAQAVQIGTAFLACEESGAPPVHRDKLFSDNAKDTVLSRVFNGRLARVIRNRLTAELAEHERELPPFPIQGWFAGTLRKAAIEKGRSDLIALQASQAAALLRHRTAATLMQELVDDTARVIGRLSR